MKAAIYTRVSTEEQRDYGYSIDGQIRELVDYCKRKKYDVIGVYNDAGFSGKNMKRPELERLLGDVKKGIVDVIVAVKVDRLTRDGYDGQWLLKEFNNYNVTLDLLYEQYDVNSVNGEMMFGLNLLFAQRERKEIASRTRRGLEEAVRQGKYPNKAPIGYVKDSNKQLQIDHTTSLIIKDIFELYTTGISMKKIADRLNLENRYNRRGTEWDERSVLIILNNPIYKGECHWGRSRQNKKQNPPIVILNHSPAIISPELYDRCQEQVDKNKHGGYGAHIHIFSGLIKCPTCNKTMSNYFTIKTTRKGEKVKYYFVICKNKNCDDHKKIYSTTKIENGLMDLLNYLMENHKNDSDSLVFTYQEKSNDLEVINKALEKLKKDESKLLELYLDSSINVDVINKKNDSIQKEIRNLEAKKQKYETTETEIINNNVSEMYQNKNQDSLLGIRKVWDILDRKDKKLLLNRYIKSIEITADDKHNIGIKNVTFRDEFIKKGINELTNIALECIKKSNMNLQFENPTCETKLGLSINDDLASWMEFVRNWHKSSGIVYPIIDLRNVLKDLVIAV